MIFDCHFLHAIVINRLSIQINRHLSTPIDCTTSSGHSTIRLFPQSIAQRRPAIRLFPQSIAQRRPAIRSFPQSIAQRHPAIRLFPQSIAQRRPTIRLFPQSIANVIRPFDYFLNRLPRVYTLGWGVSHLRCWVGMVFIPPRCIFQQPLFSSFSNLHTILWISNNLHVDDNISS